MLKTVKLNQIHDNPFRRLDFLPLDPGQIADVRRSIEAGEPVQPLVVREREDGSYELAADHTLLETLRQAMGPDAEVEVEPKTSTTRRCSACW